MKTSVMVFHPDLGQSVANRALAEAVENLHDPDITVRDMYALYPQFDIDVAAEQALAEASDRIVFQFPLYWYSSPALLKQWEDDVLEPGWAYEGDNVLTGKHLLVAVTVGGTEEIYRYEGSQNVTMDDVLVPLRSTARYLGMIYDDPFLVHGTAVPGFADLRLVQSAQAYASLLSS
ncbi:NAD(P)H-dependent oxidoreductase [Bifidobacterium choloepi]|uniref:NAD(P)H-dependent oxidoreductase n=1 Tax=Bifidobacterium choloepi TaxID=2614131 RepID=A0A6I5MXU0_9BIFI|nr:NAD(P)H-dependent oxidoreductase [Bifidobacterium choloepi]NEG69408.1 NAD(P)H-dependent oxidoreductase [Bifidobacterium choloepi]